MSVAVKPVQNVCCHHGGEIPEVVYMRAYEVYKHVHGHQEAMITGSCRGGFSTGEIIVFLYAYSFPKEEWRARCDEALIGMKARR